MTKGGEGTRRVYVRVYVRRIPTFFPGGPDPAKWGAWDPLLDLGPLSDRKLPDTELAGMRGGGRLPKANPGGKRRVIMWDEGPVGGEGSPRSATDPRRTKSRQSVEPARKRIGKIGKKGEGGKRRRYNRSRKQKAIDKRKRGW